MLAHHLWWQRRARGVGERRAGKAAITGQLCRGDAADITVRVGAVGVCGFVEGSVWFGGRHLRTGLEGAGEQRFLLGGEGGSCENGLIVMVQRSRVNDMLMIGRFVHVLGHVGLVVARSCGRVWRDEHLE